MLMSISSDKFTKLKKWNRKAATKRNVRVGAIINTSRGTGIVTDRNKNELWVAHKSDSWMWCYTYKYDVKDVQISDENIDQDSKLYKGAWQNILNYAIQRNQDYEIEKHRCIVNEYAGMIKGKKETRTISTTFGSYGYTRFVGEGYDFEICMNKPFLRDGDKVLYALGVSDTIAGMNGYGWIYRRKIKDSDVNYGKCKYVFNIDDNGNRVYD